MPNATAVLRRLAATGSATALATIAAASPAVAADDYPNRPITLVAPYSAGGDADLAARGFAAAAQRVLGQPVLVVNKVGASGVIGSSFVVAAPPDGYTLLLARTGSQSILPAIQPSTTKYKWDDYTFIGTLELNPYGCIVGAQSQYKTFDDLVKALRTRGKAMNFATAGTLTTNDMGPRQLFRLLKLEETPTQVPYKGTGDAAIAVISGDADFACGSMGPAIPLIKGGKLRAVLVTTRERMPELPDVPTAREAGLQDMEAIVGWSGVFGPPNLPVAIRDKLAAAMKKVSEDQGWKNSTAQTGSLPYVLSPDETREFARKQHELYRTLGESLKLIDANRP